MRMITLAATQMACGEDAAENVAQAESLATHFAAGVV